jgi:hypothetical protein
MTHCCAECDKEEGGVSLKMCKACMLVKYCNANCQKKHWPTHKKDCKLRAAEIRDEALFKDPPPKEECPICFLPMPKKLICCISLPPATILSVPIYDFAMANKGLAAKDMKGYLPCCGKSICKGCIYSYRNSGNHKCPFCNAERMGKTDEEQVAELMKRAEANDAASIYVLANSYDNGGVGLQEDHTKAMELYARAAELGCSDAQCHLGNICREGGNLKKAKFHLEAAAMAGHEMARFKLGITEAEYGTLVVTNCLKKRAAERAAKHWIIGASAGDYDAMHHLRILFDQGAVSREAIDAILIAYNNSCVEIRSEARDSYIHVMLGGRNI